MPRRKREPHSITDSGHGSDACDKHSIHQSIAGDGQSHVNHRIHARLDHSHLPDTERSIGDRNASALSDLD